MYPAQARRKAIESWVDAIPPSPESPHTPGLQEQPTTLPSVRKKEDPTESNTPTSSHGPGHLSILTSPESSPTHQGPPELPTKPSATRESPKIDIRLNLTDAQMDKLATALSRHNSEMSKDSRQQHHSPTRHRPSRSETIPENQDATTLLSSPHCYGGAERPDHVVSSTTQDSSNSQKLIKVHWGDIPPPENPSPSPTRSPTKRKKALANINTKTAQQYSDKKSATVNHRPPGTYRHGPNEYLVDDHSSVYSDEYYGIRLSDIKPLHVPSVKVPAPGGHTLKSHFSPQIQHSDFGETNGESPTRPKPFRVTHYSTGDTADPPLSPYFVGLSSKKEKVMIGERGWLEDTGRPKQGTPPKKGGFFQSIKKKAREMTDLAGERRIAARGGDTPVEQNCDRNGIATSLDPREQSLLYCELEYALSTTLNDFVTSQLNEGRLDLMKLKRVADSWAAKGRPQVAAFRYDLETQLDLVTLHIEDFRFFGFRQGNTVQVMSVLDGMRMHAREIKVRTFCQPDSVVRRQIMDARALADVVGASDRVVMALDQVWGFFARIVEREAMRGVPGVASGDRGGSDTGDNSNEGIEGEPVVHPRISKANSSSMKTPRQGQGERYWPPDHDQYDGLMIVPEDYEVTPEKFKYRN